MIKLLISVVMSVYNSEKYLSESIESVLNQTCANFEFIIINDGSTDSSLHIIQNYMQDDERIVLVNQENKGLPFSLNEGIEKAKGKYIARMDADDISLPTRFEEQIKFMEKNLEIGICGTWAEVFGEKKKSRILKHPITHDEMKAKLLYTVCFAHPTVFMRKRVLDENKLRYNLDYLNAQDYELWSKISEVTVMGNIPKVLLRYRLNENSITSIADSKNVELRYDLLESVYSKYIKQMGIENSGNENKLHFLINLNERIAKANICLNSFNSYLSKLIEANKSTVIFNQKYLEQLLAKKFLIVVYYKIKKKDFDFLTAIFYSLFWKASGNFIKENLFQILRKK